MKFIKSVLLKTILIFFIFSLLCGVIYPLIVTGISQVCFKDKANGSIIEVDGVRYGSELLAQEFTGNQYLWGRVMISNPISLEEDENLLYYAGPSNLTPASEAYGDLIAERVSKIQAANPDAKSEEVPVDLVTVSGSGLDPQISVNAADYQIPRIAKSRGMSEEEVQKIIDKYTDHKLFGIFGEEVVNVLEVNLVLDGILK